MSHIRNWKFSSPAIIRCLSRCKTLSSFKLLKLRTKPRINLLPLMLPLIKSLMNTSKESIVLLWDSLIILASSKIISLPAIQSTRTPHISSCITWTWVFSTLIYQILRRNMSPVLEREREVSSLRMARPMHSTTMTTTCKTLTRPMAVGSCMVAMATITLSTGSMVHRETALR